MSRRRSRLSCHADGPPRERRKYSPLRPAFPLILLGSILLQGCMGIPMSSASDKRMADQPEPRPAEGPYDLPTGPGPPPRYSDEQLSRMAYDRAVEDGSNAALEMFLARNPGSPYASQARKLLSSRHAADDPVTIRRVAGSDADVVAAFDRARLSGDPEQLQAFIARHGSHPLGEEAKRLLRQ